ncbi:MAG: methylmalonyl Co-A mutase-associated GTPase MeaB [Acidobacteria bacterium]|nr:MAG: methylmalonyl Co-A mutase-associated GTPase MeaB [Acidobacteriota bacterium]
MLTIPELVRAACGPGPTAARSAARLMSVLADAPHRLPEVFHAAARVSPGEVDRLLMPRMLVGITGAPGSGKSTLTDALIRAYRQRHPAYRLGVVAVDPSSPFTGGAVLGDRVRMMRHATDPLVFVRSMASRGHLGGLALGVKGVIRVMGLIGCEVVFVETVGVGQSEVEVASVADLVMIVLAPGQGDSIQLLKAGLMEIGDLFIVNKADRPDAARLHADLLSMLRIAQADPFGHHAGLPAEEDADQDLAWGPLITRRPGTNIEPRTYLVSGEQGQGVEDLVSGLDDLASTHAPGWQQQRRQMIAEEVREAVLEEAGRRVRQTLRGMGEGQEPVAAVLGGALSVGDAAARLLRETCQQKGQA